MTCGRGWLDYVNVYVVYDCTVTMYSLGVLGLSRLSEQPSLKPLLEGIIKGKQPL